MTFQLPIALWALLLVPLAMAAYLLAERRRGAHTARFASGHLMPNLLPRTPGWRRHAPPALYLLALSGLLLSLARPTVPLRVPREAATVVLVMDTSVSMGATDVLPNRLAAANSAGRRFLQAVPAPVRVAMISFSNAAELVAAPTTNRVLVQQALDTMRAGGGTAMGDALALAVAVARTSLAPAGGAQPTVAPTATRPIAGTTGITGTATTPPPAAILLLSDGANTAGQLQPLDAAAQAQQLGIPVYTVALGTTAGVIENPDGSGGPLSVPPDEATLRRVASLTGGQFFSAPSAADLQAVYARLGSNVDYIEEPQEVTSAVAGVAALLLVAGSALSVAWFNRFP